MYLKKEEIAFLFSELLGECNYEAISSFLTRRTNRQLVRSAIDNSSKDCVLHIAAKNASCKVEVVRLLLTCGADVSARNKAMETPLHIALQQINYNHDVIKLFIDKGASLGAKDRDGFIPLHIAVKNVNCDSNILEALINKGSDVNQGDSRGHNFPLQLLFSNENCNARAVSLLLEHGAKLPDKPWCPSTILQEYVMGGHSKIEVINELIANGEDITACNPISKDIFQLLIWNPDSYDCLHYFLNTYKCNVNDQNCLGYTDLHTAMTLHFIDEKVIALLLKHGSNVNIVDFRNRTPLHHAINNAAVVKTKGLEMVLDAGASFSVLDESETSPLGIAVGKYKKYPLVYEECTKMLLKYAVKQSFVDHKKWQNCRFKKIFCSTLCPDVNYNDYGTLYTFIKKCQLELVQMKSDMLQQNFSLLQLISKETYTFNEDIIPNIFKNNISHQYPIYQHCIIQSLPRSLLRRVLHTVNVYSRSECEGEKSQTIILDSLCIDNIIMYLNKQDIYNLCVAYCPARDIFKSDSKMTKRRKLC